MFLSGHATPGCATSAEDSKNSYHGERQQSIPAKNTPLGGLPPALPNNSGMLSVFTCYLTTQKIIYEKIRGFCSYHPFLLPELH
jgi:hypothetical protein